MDDNKIKKRTWLQDVLVIVGGIVGIGALIILIGGMLLLCMSMPLFYGFSLLAETEDELLFTSTSPNSEYVLEANRVNTAAIEPYHVMVNRVDGDETRRVYYVRGQDDVEIIWLSDTVAQINGVPVDVTSGECFKANARGYFDVVVQVKAKDVQWLEVTVCMNGEPRVTRSRVGVLLEDPVDAWGLSPRLNVLKELHWDDDLSKKKAGLTVKLRTVNGQEITLPYLWEWTALEYGKYTFTLTGSAAWGYTLTPEGVECTVTRIDDEP